MQELRRISVAELQSAAWIQRTASYSDTQAAARCSVPSASFIRLGEVSPQQDRQNKTGKNSCQHLLNSGTVD